MRTASVPREFRYDARRGDYHLWYNPTVRARLTREGQFGVYGGGMPVNPVVYTEQHLALQGTVRRFAADKISPEARRIDAEDLYPRQIMKELAELGILGAIYPEAYGGAGMDMVSQVIIMEEIARHSASVALNINVQASLAANPLLYGSEAQRQNYLVPALKFNKVGAFGLSEPDAGSDAFGSMRTTVTREGEGFVLNGSKMFITQGTVADYIIVFVRTDAIEEKEGSVSAFVVDTNRPGISRKRLHMMGMRGTMTTEFAFDNVKLEPDDLIGHIGEGKKIVIDTLNKGRIIVAGIALGILRAALEDATKYASERRQFGKPIIEFQAVRHTLADIKTAYLAARQLTLEAAQQRDRKNMDFSDAAAAAKLFASKASVTAALKAVQIAGGYGYSVEYPFERYFRDAILLTIGEGTSNMQREVLGRGLVRA